MKTQAVNRRTMRMRTGILLAIGVSDSVEIIQDLIDSGLDRAETANWINKGNGGIMIAKHLDQNIIN